MVVRIVTALFLFLFALDVSSGTSYKLTILYTNDCHARFEQMNKYGGQCSDKDATANKCYGGVARRLTKVKELRAKEKNVVLLDGGDQFQGTFWFYFGKGQSTAEFMNKLGYDAMGIGNHEFDLGLEPLADFIKNVTFPVLSCNIDASNEPKFAPSLTKSTVLVVGGQKIGVVGYTTRETPFISDPEKLKFLDEAEYIQKEVDKMTAQGINKIIAVGHSGYAVDLKIAEKVRGVDVMVGGHSNTFLYTGNVPANEKAEGKYPTVVEQPGGAKVLVVQDYAFGKYLGMLNVVFNDTGHVESWEGNPILLDNNTKEDSALRDYVNQTRVKMDKRLFAEMARTVVFLNGTRADCRVSECNLGNLLADSLIHRNLNHADSVYWSKAAISIWNSGGIRTSLQKGPIAMVQLLGVAPFQNTIDIIKISGDTLWKVLEHSASGIDDADGSFLQVSGLIVTYNLEKPIGERLVSVMVRCAECDVPVFDPLDKTKAYMVILPEFIERGGDYYTMIKPNLIERHVLGDLDSDILFEYVKAISPIFIGEEDRIRFIDEKNVPPCKPQITNAATRINEIFLFMCLLVFLYCFWSN